MWTFRPNAAAAGATSYSNRILFQSATLPADRSYVESIVTASHIKSLPLNEYDKKSVNIRLTPRQTGDLHVDGVVGRISATNEPNNLWGKLAFERVPIKLDMTKASSATAADKTVQFDRKLEITVLPPLSALHVQFSAIPTEVIAGEIIPVQVSLCNAGTDALADVYAASETPRWILGDVNGQQLPLSVLKGDLVFRQS